MVHLSILFLSLSVQVVEIFELLKKFQEVATAL